MSSLSRRHLLASLTSVGCGLTAGRSAVAVGTLLEAYKSPWCGCCNAWIQQMQAAGFVVEAHDVDDLAPLKTMLGIAPELQSCHTALVDGYVVEGHVPAREVARLLAERPVATGLAVPGMPIGSPGMEQGDVHEPYAVVLFKGDERSVFARY